MWETEQRRRSPVVGAVDAGKRRLIGPTRQITVVALSHQDGAREGTDRAAPFKALAAPEANSTPEVRALPLPTDAAAQESAVAPGGSHRLRRSAAVAPNSSTSRPENRGSRIGLVS